jgi:hypothetical protein
MRVDVSALVIGVSCGVLLFLFWAMLRAMQMMFVMMALQMSDPFVFRRAVMGYMERRRGPLYLYDFVEKVCTGFAAEAQRLDKLPAELEDKHSDDEDTAHDASDGTSVHSTQDGLDDYAPQDS